MVNQMLDRANQYIASYIANATRSSELVVRWVIAGAVVISLLLPGMFALLQWINEVLSLDSKRDDLGFVLGEYAFEVMVIMLVTMFAVAILFALATNTPELEIVIIGVGFVMVTIAALLLGETSNRCLIDLQCDRGLYIAVMGMVFGLAIFGYLLPRALGRSAQWFGITFLAVAWWQSELWIWNAISRHGIPASEDSLRGVLLLFAAFIMMILFGRSRAAEPKPAAKKRKGY